MEQVGVLLDEGLGLPQRAGVDVTHVLARKGDASLVHVPEPHEQTAQRALSAAAPSSDPHDPAGGNLGAHVGEDLLAAVGEAHVLGCSTRELDVTSPSCSGTTGSSSRTARTRAPEAIVP